MASDLTFSTKISGEQRGALQMRGVPLKKLITEADFVASLYLSLTGKLPSPDAKALLNAIMVAALDPGLEPATGYIPRAVMSSGAELTTAIATGILALGPKHGAAVSDAMQVILEIRSSKGATDTNVQRLVTEYRKQKKRLPGFGHPKGRQTDERALTLFAMARRSHIPLDALDIALNIETALEEQVGRKLPLNIDGAIAALLVALDIDPLAGNGLYAAARAAGSIAHCIEEVHQENGVRRLRSDQVEYSNDVPTK